MSGVVAVKDPLLGVSRGAPQQAITYALEHDATGPYIDYIAEVYRLAPLVGLDALLAVAQSAEETACWTSEWWKARTNPAGIGITGDARQNAASPTFATGAAAARAQLAHLLLYATGSINRGGLTTSDDVRYRDYRDEYGLTAAATTLAALAGTWAADKNYAVSIAQHANAILAVPIAAPSPTGEPPMTEPYVYAPTPYRRQLLPAGWPTRPGQKLDVSRGPIHITVHETANEAPGANAAMHANWVHSQDAVNSQVSIHFFLDDHEIVQILPLDEIAWHAGDGCNDPSTDVGCFRSISIEKCVDAGANEAKANENLAELICRIAQGDPLFDWGGGSTKGKADTDHINQHIEVSQEVPPHDCPNHLRHETLPGWNWQKLMDAVDWFAPYVAANLTGATHVPTPTPAPAPKPVPYAAPTPITTASATVIPTPSAHTTRLAVTPRASASTAAKATGPDVPKGTAVTIAWTILSTTTRSLWLVDTRGQRFPASAFYG